MLVLDTNALIQLYIEETFSNLVRKEIAITEEIGLSAFAFLEAVGALGSMHRAKKITKKQYISTKTEILLLRDYVFQIAVTQSSLEKAIELCQQYPLKGADALHLAGAVRLFVFRPSIVFLTLDKTLYKTAQNENIPVVIIPEFESGR
jgi:predicted nucleic acid-binding protein